MLATLKVLTLATVFPSAARPLLGVFVYERIRHAARLAHIQVVAPQPWFRRRAPRGSRDVCSDVRVTRPTFYYVPATLKWMDGALLFMSILPHVTRLRRRFDFDLVDAHFGFPDGIAGVLLARWFHRPVIITLRGSELEHARFRLRLAAMRWALTRADRVIALSQQLARFAEALGVSRDRLEVIENGVDTDRFVPTDTVVARLQLGLPASARLIVCVGHLARVKRFDIVLRALPSLISDFPTLRCVIVGGAPSAGKAYAKELAAAITALGLEGRVSITGSVGPDHVAIWLNAADVFVLASEREGSPNALREALACGCPVVACNVGDVGDILPEYAGVIVGERADMAGWRSAIQLALRKTWDRAAIRAYALQHPWSGIAERVVTAWASLPAAGIPQGEALSAGASIGGRR